MTGRTSRRAILRAGLVVLLFASAGCASSVTAPNDAAVSVENEDSVAHAVQIQISVENRTVVSNTTQVGPGNESTLNGTTVPVTGSDRRYRVSVSLEDGQTSATTFVAGEFDSVRVVVQSDGTVQIGRVDAA
jgi:hypothetical protein